MTTLFASDCKWALCKRKRDSERLGDHIHAKHVSKIPKSEKKFTCMWHGCNETFSYRSLLTCHINLVHIGPLQNTSNSENSSFESEGDLSSEIESSREINKEETLATSNAQALHKINWTPESTFDRGEEIKCKHCNQWLLAEKLYEHNKNRKDHSNVVPKVKCHICLKVFFGSTIRFHCRECKSTNDSTLNTNNSKVSTLAVNWTSETIIETGQHIKCKHCDQWLLAEKLYGHNKNRKDHSNEGPRVKCRLCSNVFAASFITIHYQLCESKSYEAQRESSSQEPLVIDSNSQSLKPTNNNNKAVKLRKSLTVTSPESSEPAVLEHGCEIACRICQKTFLSQHIYHHMTRTHKDAYNGRVKCTKCEEIFSASCIKKHYLYICKRKIQNNKVH